MMQNRCLIVFVKYPQPGQVKSRLANDFDSDFAALLYKAFVFDILECAMKGDWQLRIFFYPPEKETEIKIMFGNDHEYRPQTGADLGARMKNAFDDCFSEGFKSVVLIGSDIPDLPLKLIKDTFAALDRPGDAVIGPAADGGYYLIGFRYDKFLPAVFEGLTWSTVSVFPETLKILQTCGYQTEIIREWQDVDTRDDLINLMERNKSTAFAHSRTMKVLAANRNYFIS
jgi:rSAM/selenodomain-associated transferase 1